MLPNEVSQLVILSIIIALSSVSYNFSDAYFELVKVIDYRNKTRSLSLFFFLIKLFHLPYPINLTLIKLSFSTDGYG